MLFYPLDCEHGYDNPRDQSSFSGMDLNTEAGRQSAVVTMTLMQMVADAYEGAQGIWDKNSRRGMVKGVSDVRQTSFARPYSWLIAALSSPIHSDQTRHRKLFSNGSRMQNSCRRSLQHKFPCVLI